MRIGKEQSKANVISALVCKKANSDKSNRFYSATLDPEQGLRSDLQDGIYTALTASQQALVSAQGGLAPSVQSKCSRVTSLPVCVHGLEEQTWI